MSTGHIPANVLRILAVVEASGPQTPESLSAELAAQGVALSPSMILSAADRFPHHLAVDAGGRVLPAPSAKSPDDLWAQDSEESVEPKVALLPPVVWGGVLILAVEPVPHGDRVWRVSGSLGDGTWEWSSSDLPLADALTVVEGAAREAGVELVVALSPGTQQVADLLPPEARAATSWLAGLPVAELFTLSAIVQPSLEYRELVDLEQLLALDGRDRSTARRICAVIQALIAAVDPTDSSWRVALGALHAGGSPWARLLPTPDPWSLEADVRCARDPLLVRAEGPSYFSTSRGVEQAARELAERTLRTFRPQQLEMSTAIADAFDAPGDLAVEAPTGTGKTLAYLVPAAVRGARPGVATVIATHTKVLQRQIRREVETLRETGLFAPPFRQLFGVGNYICTREVADALTSLQDGGADSEHSVAERRYTGEAIAVALRGLATSQNGVWDDITDLPLRRASLDYAVARSRLATDPAECERSDCSWARECPLMLRRAGLTDDPGVISTNHAVIATWAAAPEGAPAGLLGEDSQAAFVFDEAHRLEDSVTSAWTEETGRAVLSALLFDLGRSRGRAARSARGLRKTGVDVTALDRAREIARALQKTAGELDQAVGAYVHEYAGRENRIELRRGVVDSRPEFALIRDASVRITRSMTDIISLLGEMDATIRATVSEYGGNATLRRSWRVLKSLHRRCTEQRDLLTAMTNLKDGHRYVHLLSVDVTKESEVIEWTYERIPVEIGDLFHSLIQTQARSITLTSATLRVADSFEFIRERLGLKSLSDTIGPDGNPGRVFTELALTSPFDFDRQSTVVLTSHLPVPVPVNEDEFCEAAAAETIGFLSLSGGRTLALYAARRRMQKVVDGVRTREEALAERGVHLLVQGEHAPSEIQSRFVQDEGTALFGLQSYWEGFDAPGRTLSFVQLEKAPYPPPDDPLINARSRAIADRGGNPFLDYVVPRTAIALAQGFGRLIRGPEDKGAAFILDRRLQHPTMANEILLSTLPTNNFYIPLDRADGWRHALSFVDAIEPDITQALDAPASEVMQRLADLRLDMSAPLEPQLERAAAELFGIEHLLPEQLELMVATLTGRDAVGILPTGTGKSLTFQLPAVLRDDGRPTVVISPLVALIKDQVDELRARRGLRVVAGITGRTSGAERTELLRDLADGRIRLLYVAPERLTADVALRGALASRDLAVLVVDEAHCISNWGHDFRPEFRQIARGVEDFHVGATLALTATATSEVERDVIGSLRMTDPLVVRRAVTRPDLRYRVMHVNSDRERVREILRLFENDRHASGLVYVTRRALADEVAWVLRQAGISARSYHAGMEPGQRESVQDDFLDGTTQVVVATKAFGMGVNKPDIAWVVHYDAPESLEAYVQEAGRAARDLSLTGDCVLIVRPGDIVRHRKMLGVESDRDRLTRVMAVWSHLLELVDHENVAIFDADEMADTCQLEKDEVATALGWLEQTSHLLRRPDTADAGMVAPGRGEPEDLLERDLFRQLTLQHLSLRAGQRRRIDSLPNLAAALNVDRDQLERLLIDWTMRRLLTFQPTQRRWRVVLQRQHVDEIAVTRLLRDWRASQHRRLDDLQAYVDPTASGSECRRIRVARTFGDAELSCRQVQDAQLCDVCADVRPTWHAVPLERVPDPEKLVDVETVVLQAVRWATSYTKGSYGEAGLKMAILGEDQYPSGRPLTSGLLSCPQFGALKYLRGAPRRLNNEIDTLIRGGLLERNSASRENNSYDTLTITPAGVQHLLGVQVA